MPPEPSVIVVVGGYQHTSNVEIDFSKFTVSVQSVGKNSLPALLSGNQVFGLNMALWLNGRAKCPWFNGCEFKSLFFSLLESNTCELMNKLQQTLQTYIIVPPPARNYKVISPEVLDYVERKRKRIGGS